MFLAPTDLSSDVPDADSSRVAKHLGGGGGRLHLQCHAYRGEGLGSGVPVPQDHVGIHQGRAVEGRVHVLVGIGYGLQLDRVDRVHRDVQLARPGQGGPRLPLPS